MNSTVIQVSSPLWIFFGVYMLIITLATIPPNIMVIFIFAKIYSRRPGLINFLVISIAVNNVLQACIAYPMAVASNFEHKWIFGNEGCRFYGFCVHVFALSTICQLAVVAYRQWRIIKLKTIKREFLSIKRQVYVVIATWIYGIIWSVPPYFGWSKYVPEGIGTSCSVAWESKDPIDTSYTLSLLISNFVIPFSIIVYSYTRIWKKLRNHKEYISKSRGWSSSIAQGTHKSINTKLTKPSPPPELKGIVNKSSKSKETTIEGLTGYETGKQRKEINSNTNCKNRPKKCIKGSKQTDVVQIETTLVKKGYAINLFKKQSEFSLPSMAEGSAGVCKDAKEGNGHTNDNRGVLITKPKNLSCSVDSDDGMLSTGVTARDTNPSATISAKNGSQLLRQSVEKHKSLSYRVIETKNFAESLESDNREITKTLLLVVTLFCLTWLPYVVLSLMLVTGIKEQLSPLAGTFPAYLAKTCTVFTPYAYAWKHPQFKEHWKLLKTRFFLQRPIPVEDVHVTST